MTQVDNPSPPLTIEQQADLCDEIVRSCTMADGKFAGESFVRFDAERAEHMQALARRLRRMAPYHSEIARLVTGR